MYTLFLTMFGGALGAGARYLASGAIARAFGTGWPWGTLTVNVVGGFLMGLLVARIGDANDPWRILIGVGMLGGFTTFSAFSLEAVTLIQRGAGVSAAAYIINSVGLSLGALFLGLWLGR